MTLAITMQRIKGELSDHDVAGEERRIILQGLLFGLVIVVLVLALGAISYRLQLQSEMSEIEAEQLAKVAQANRLLGEEMVVISNLLVALYNTVSFSGLLKAPDQASLDKLAKYFVYYGSALLDVHQIRWLDQSGQERVRVNFDRQRQAQLVTADALQNKASRNYFQQGMQQDHGAIHLSAIDLNMELGEVELPLRPSLRAAYRTGSDQAMPAGLLVINYDLKRVFKLLEELNDDRNTLRMANHAGHWLLHEDSVNSWGWLLQQPQNNLAMEEPAIWQRMTGPRTTDGDDESHISQGVFWTIKRFERPWIANLESSRQKSNLFLISSTRVGVLRDLQLGVALPVFSITILLLGVLLVLVYREVNTLLQKQRLNLRRNVDRNLLQNSYLQLQQAYTRQRLLQEELIESRKLSALGLAVAGMAHEINTPAGGACMTVDTLLHNIEDLNEDASRFRQIADNQTRGLQLVKRQLQKILGLVKSYKRLALERSHETAESYMVHKWVTEILQGTIDVSSNQGFSDRDPAGRVPADQSSGTTFTLLLPASIARAEDSFNAA